jgi:hypothetical protein
MPALMFNTPFEDRSYRMAVKDPNERMSMKGKIIITGLLFVALATGIVFYRKMKK